MDLVEAFELHSPKDVRASIAAGASATALIEGKRPVDILIEMYTRSPQFAACLRVMLDAGATVGDPLLEAILLDDDAALRAIPDISQRMSPLCAYTCCDGVTALHVCVEFNSVRCAQQLIERGTDANARADMDADGLGGQTPLFHAVNSNGNYCRPVMELLVEAGADLDVRLRGLVWGKSMPWETVLFDVTPFSYAQCGLYKQFHRREEDIYNNVSLLYRKRYGISAPVRNVPNQYLMS